MLKNIRVVFALIFLLMSSGSAVSADVVYPQRIVSLVPTITEEIYLLGADERLVADTIYCRRPPEAQGKEKVGTVVEVNLEKIITLRQDLI